MNQSLRQKIHHSFRDRVDGAGLGLFRLLWGIAMCLEVNWLHNQLHDMHRPDVVHFHYQGFSWIRHFPEPWMMEIECGVMLFCAVLMSAGLWFRIATVVFGFAYAHFFFSQAITYNNHLYLIILVAFLLAFTRADERFSLAARLRAKRGRLPGLVPKWNYQIFRLQVIILYFYGAVAKIDRDWLVEMEPVRFWLNHSPYPPELLSRLIKQDWFVPVTAWGGLLIDLFCPFMLLFRKTRLVAILILVAFHGINSQIFNIGYFPLLGILLILPFLRPSLWRKEPSPETVANRGGNATKVPILPRSVPGWVLGAYFIFQVLFPLRWHLWRPANPLWTEKGQRFAWRMMLREKVSDFRLCFDDPEVETWVANRPGILPILTPRDQMRVGQNPYFIWQYVQEVRRSLEALGKSDTPIHVFATCSLNGRPYYPIIDPNVDLAKAECPMLTIPPWIVPLPELKVDFEQIFPLENRESLSDQAIRDWVAQHPGPATRLLERIHPPTTPSSEVQRPKKGF